MIQIDNTLVSSEILEEEFVCDLSACKGACCVEGESGAPLEEEELSVLDDLFEDLKPFLRKEGVEAIERQGKYIVDTDGEYVTPLINGKECAYTVFDENGTAKCGIEQAYNKGKVDFRKPVSCHLYPVRITKYEEFDAVNYHRWPICEPACECGKKLKVSVFRFLKDALTRKYGESWVKQLEKVDREWNKKKA